MTIVKSLIPAVMSTITMFLLFASGANGQESAKSREETSQESASSEEPTSTSTPEVLIWDEDYPEVPREVSRLDRIFDRMRILRLRPRRAIVEIERIYSLEDQASGKEYWLVRTSRCPPVVSIGIPFLDEGGREFGGGVTIDFRRARPLGRLGFEVYGLSMPLDRRLHNEWQLRLLKGDEALRFIPHETEGYLNAPGFGIISRWWEVSAPEMSRSGAAEAPHAESSADRARSKLYRDIASDLFKHHSDRSVDGARSKVDSTLLEYLDDYPDNPRSVRFVVSSGAEARDLVKDHGLEGREGFLDDRASVQPGVELKTRRDEAIRIAADARVRWVTSGDPGWGYGRIPAVATAH